MQTATLNEQLDWLATQPGDPRAVPTTVLIAAHPDDEVIGAGSRLPMLAGATIIHVTDGAPPDGRDAAAWGFATRQDYALARRRELVSALALAGISPKQTLALGYVDQHASLHMAELSRRIAELLDERRPRFVVTHPYEGGHPDHDATAFAVHAACRLLRHRGLAPTIVEMTSYHNGPAGIQPGRFLPLNHDDAGECEPISVILSRAEQELKRRMFDCFPTQRGTLQYFPLDVERFRLAPSYDFTEPPHDGRLFYEQFPWGMTGERFGNLAREAMGTLGIAGPL